MEKNVIEDAAKSYADGIAQGVDRKTYCIEDFMAGANWMLDSLWHGMGEKPNDGDVIICAGSLIKGYIMGEAEMCDGRISLHCFPQENIAPKGTYSRGWVDLSNFDRWLRLSDLL